MFSLVLLLEVFMSFTITLVAYSPYILGCYVVVALGLESFHFVLFPFLACSE